MEEICVKRDWDGVCGCDGIFDTSEEEEGKSKSSSFSNARSNVRSNVSILRVVGVKISVVNKRMNNI